MRFKEVYGSGELTLGPFYRSDIRKVAAQRMYYPAMFGEISDAIAYVTSRVDASNSMFFSGRQGKRVICYIAFDPIVGNLWTVFHPFRIYKRRARKSAYLGLARLALKFGFEEMGLGKIAGTMPSVPYVLKSLSKLAEEIGMKKEGVMRRADVCEGRIVDIHFYGLLKSEWEEISWV